MARALRLAAFAALALALPSVARAEAPTVASERSMDWIREELRRLREQEAKSAGVEAATLDKFEKWAKDYETAAVGIGNWKDGIEKIVDHRATPTERDRCLEAILKRFRAEGDKPLTTAQSRLVEAQRKAIGSRVLGLLIADSDHKGQEVGFKLLNGLYPNRNIQGQAGDAKPKRLKAQKDWSRIVD
jgi:hypothetical protein